MAIALRLVSRRAPVPYPVLLAAAGILVGLLPDIHRGTPSADLILLAFVPGLVFEATLGLDLENLRHNLTAVVLLASLGVAMTVVGVGGLSHLWLGFAWGPAMLLGAIVAPTDPIAVTALLRRLHGPARLTALLEGESLFNDGTGIAVFSAVLGALLSTGGFSAGGTLLRFLLITFGGAAIGLAVGAASLLLRRFVHEREVAILLSLLVAYGSYLAADVSHTSGVVAVVAAGLLVGWRRRSEPRAATTAVLEFWEVLAFVLNAVLFVLIGTVVPTQAVVRAAPLVLVAFLIMLAVRAAPAYLILGIVDPLRRRLPWRWRHLVFWGGIRGALSIALALSVAGRPGIPADISTVAYGVVLLSLIVQGGLVGPVAALLRVGRAVPAPEPA